MTGADAEANMDLDFDNYWTATDEYPILEWQVQDVDLTVSQPSIGEGETTSVTVELTLDDGSSVTATEVADYDSEEAVASVSDGWLDATSIGQTELTATVAGESDTVTVEVLEPPNIEFVDAAFDTEAAVAGTTVEATATYANTGGPGSETVTVLVDGEDVTTSTVHVDADGETATTLEWTADASGPVEIEGQDLGDLTVADPANVSLESIALPDETAQDSEYEIDLELSNDLELAVVDTVELRVDGDRVATERVEIDAGGSTETITYAHDEQGTATHVVELHDDQETGTLEVLPPAEFELEALDVPETVDEGERATIDATVTNVGGGADDAEIVLVIDGETVETQSVTLAADESERLEFDATFGDAGEIDVAVESPDSERTTVVTVEAVEADDGGDGMPGFTASVALFAIALAVIATRRR
ncbi:hypothetical protein OB955_01535 [Halobacteria archaeon AArc-m2/3/4]|uniref:CARDB domain-containing protein n=1 Tax=Natronoglomus mannanivorans TaxID=2979990 RepID=A0ABT2Q921_9EURY|nr:hypothetical protein [Halobacteria archaeon AArc-m2/3/4]